jgi:signal peptidase I
MRSLFRKATLLADSIENLLARDRSKMPPEVRLHAQQTISELRDSIRRKDELQTEQRFEELRSLHQEHLGPIGKPIWRAVLEFIALVVVVSLFLRTFVVAAFTIPTSSMHPTLAPGDVILVWKSAYGVNVPLTGWRLLKIRSPRRWEVIAFSTRNIPVDSSDRGQNFVKRVAGLPGEEIEIKDGEIYVNGKLAPKPKSLKKVKYINKGMLLSEANRKVKVPAGKYFVLGDNTYDSEDSRFWGFVPENSIRGRAFLVFFPVNRLRAL